MKNNIFIIIAALVITILLLYVATMIHLSKTSEYSRASDTTDAPSQTSGQ